LSSLYSLIPTDNGYSFITDSGFEYAIYFTEYCLADKDGKEMLVPSLGFGPVKGKGDTYDVKIKNTIISVIVDFFLKNEENGLLYFPHPIAPTSTSMSS
jgi:hypothetical protein